MTPSEDPTMLGEHGKCCWKIQIELSPLERVAGGVVVLLPPPALGVFEAPAGDAPPLAMRADFCPPPPLDCAPPRAPAP